MHENFSQNYMHMVIFNYVHIKVFNDQCTGSVYQRNAHKVVGFSTQMHTCVAAQAEQ